MPDGQYPNPRFSIATIDNDPVNPEDVARKGYVDSLISGLSVTFVHRSEAGIPNGYATLGGDGLVPPAQLPVTTGTLNLRGTWNATTNTPTLGNSGAGGSKNDYYIVGIAGSTSLDGVSSWVVGDWAVNNGSVWQKSATSSGFGTMANQNATGVAITGGSTTGQTVLGLSSGDALQPLSLVPDVGVAITNTTGDIVAFWDPAGFYHLAQGDILQATIQSLTVNAIAITGPFAPSSVTTQLFTMSDTVQSPPDGTSPNIQFSWADALGNVGVHQGQDGKFNAALATTDVSRAMQTAVRRTTKMIQGPPTPSFSAPTADSANTTYHLCATLDAPGIDGIRIHLPNFVTPAPGVTVKGCIAFSTSINDYINPLNADGSAATWVPITFNNAGDGTVDWWNQSRGTISLAVNASVSSGVVLPFASGVVSTLVGSPVYGRPIRPGTVVSSVDVGAQTITLSATPDYTNLGGIANGKVFQFSPLTTTLADCPSNMSCTFTSTDVVPISSPATPRSDGGRWPVVMIRLYLSGSTPTILITSLSGALGTAWGNEVGDRVWSCRSGAGDHVASPAGWAPGADNGKFVAAFIEYYSRARGITVAVIGDSQMEGNGAQVQGLGFVPFAVMGLSSPACPITYINIPNAWANNSGIPCVFRPSWIPALKMWQPNLVIDLAWSPNDALTDLAQTQNETDWQYQEVVKTTAMVESWGGQTLLYTPTPAGSPNLDATTDPIRLTARTRAKNFSSGQGGQTLDIETIVGDGASPVASTLPYMDANGYHLGQYGQQVVGAAIARMLHEAIGV